MHSPGSTVNRMHRLVIALSLAVFGCGDSSGASGKRDGGAKTLDATAEGANSSGEAAGSGVATQVQDSDIAALERPAKVSALSFKQVNASARSRARALNAAGLKLYHRRNYRGAIAKYIGALQADPGHVLARYNLSCAYNLAGEPEKGLALLNEFRQRGCKECRERLVRASEDADWHSMWNHPLFVEIVGVPIGDAESEKPFWLQGVGCPVGARLVGKAGSEVYCARGGTRHGPYARWHGGAKEALAETGRYEMGRRSSTWKTFDAEGRLTETGPYRLGNKHGVWSEWYASGSQAVDGRFVNGLRQGRWTWFEESGAITKQADFARGRRGAWIVAPKPK